MNSSCASSPQLSADNTRLYVASLAGDVFAFQSNDGTVLWKHPLPKPIFSTVAIWKERFLLIGCVDQKLYCLNCETGEQVWILYLHTTFFAKKIFHFVNYFRNGRLKRMVRSFPLHVCSMINYLSVVTMNISMQSTCQMNSRVS